MNICRSKSKDCKYCRLTKNADPLGSIPYTYECIGRLNCPYKHVVDTSCEKALENAEMLYEKYKTKEQKLIDILNDIKNKCREETCQDCKMLVQNNEDGEPSRHRCQISWLAGNLSNDPYKWNIEKIKKIIEM